MATIGKLISGTKFRWDRNWIFYRVQAVLEESIATDPWPAKSQDEINQHSNNQMHGWTGHIIQLATPILLDASVKDIVATPDVRIYPPFRLNKKNSITSLFDDVKIPNGVARNTEEAPIPGHAVKGITTALAPKDTFVADGLRIDTKSGVQLDELLAFLLSAIRQYTKQWWAASPRSPFDIGLRMSFDLQKDFTPKDILRAKGAGTARSPWFGTAATQKFIGLEQTLTASIWAQVAECIRQQKGLEPALQLYLDAIDAFMSYNDTQCILSIALVFEICENKSLLMDGRSIKSKNKDLLRNPTLATGDLTEVFRKVITDRDNIAHGRPPYHYKKDFTNIVYYIEAATELINRYVAKCHKYGWSKAVELSL